MQLAESAGARVAGLRGQMELLTPGVGSRGDRDEKEKSIHTS